MNEETKAMPLSEAVETAAARRADADTKRQQLEARQRAAQYRQLLISTSAVIASGVVGRYPANIDSKMVVTRALELAVGILQTVDNLMIAADKIQAEDRAQAEQLELPLEEGKS